MAVSLFAALPLHASPTLLCLPLTCEAREILASALCIGFL
jgi:hypothetical protein